jgi:ABC-type polysaccharide/polyol phosphate transport system ATPase subunit
VSVTVVDSPDHVAETAIAIRGLCKAYRTYENQFDFLKEAITGRTYHSEKQVLRSIDLDIARGEIVGVMGRNGAGKSTLLKILAGTLSPTSGHVTIRGKVAAILELGTGFNAAYSGRDNVIMSGLMRGLSEQAIARRFDEIVDFAGLAHVIDEPFHTYSSGMQARLAFAVATAVDADVLIIDEALAAGDIRFAARSLSRLHEICSEGVTALFVSHVSYSVMQLCSRAVWLEEGAVVMDGDPIDVVRAYEYQMHTEIAQDQGRLSTTVAMARRESGDVGGSSAPDVEADDRASVGSIDAVGDGNEEVEDTASTDAPRMVCEASDQDSDERPSTKVASPTAPPTESDDASASIEEAVENGRTERPAAERFTTGEYRITDIGFFDADGQRCDRVAFGGVLELVVEYECLLPELPEHSCGLAVAFNRVTDFEAVMYFNTNYPHSDDEIRDYFEAPFRKERHRAGRIVGRIDPIQLRPDKYYVSLGILPNRPGPHEFYEYHHCERQFTVLANGFEEPSVFYPMVSWSHQSCHS